MKQKTTSLEVPTNKDLNCTDVDISNYIDQYPTIKSRIHKKRNSVVILNLKNQLKKESRFLSLLCNKTIKSRKASETPCNQVLSIPGTLNQYDMNSENTCPTPLRNEMLRTIYTPVNKPRIATPTLFCRSSPITISTKPAKFQQNPRTKLKKKRIFKISEKSEAYKISLSPKLKKRSLNSVFRNFRMFDNQEILNITNGDFY